MGEIEILRCWLPVCYKVDTIQLHLCNIRNITGSMGSWALRNLGKKSIKTLRNELHPSTSAYTTSFNIVLCFHHMKIAVLISRRLRFCKSYHTTREPRAAYSRYWGPMYPQRMTMFYSSKTNFNQRKKQANFYSSNKSRVSLTHIPYSLLDCSNTLECPLRFQSSNSEL